MRRERLTVSKGVWAAALGIALMHLLTNGRYGFHRDELQFLSDARHLDWGFVSYPPFTPFIERVSMAIFGLWMPGLRLASVLAQAGVVVLAGAMARRAGGGRGAQVMAALLTGFTPLLVFEGTEFQYTTFEQFWCVLACYGVFRVVGAPSFVAARPECGDPSPAAQDDTSKKWWLLVGLSAGMAVETKYTAVFFIAGVLCGFLFTPARRLLWNRWFAAAVAVTVLLALPNLIWQARHGFISLHFLQSIHKRDVEEGRGGGFWTDQLWICALSASAPVWVAGIWRATRERAWRPVAWMWAVPVLFFGVTHARGYYTGAEYPMLLALGTPVCSAWLARRGTAVRRSMEAVWGLVLAVNAVAILLVLVPFASSGRLKMFALRHNDDLRAELGWADTVAKVAAIRDSLPPDQRASYGVITGNYGAQGAVEILGKQYGLPVPISRTNSAWLRGYPDPPPKTLIVLGFWQGGVNEAFADCRVVGNVYNKEGVETEETKWRPFIYVCSGPRLPWPQFWKEYQSFG